jgi:hypothetical protein
MPHSTRAIRSNLSNSLARPERAEQLLAARRGSLDQGSRPCLRPANAFTDSFTPLTWDRLDPSVFELGLKPSKNGSSQGGKAFSRGCDCGQQCSVRKPVQAAGDFVEDRDPVHVGSPIAEKMHFAI